MKWCYGIVNNYGFAIILFTLFSKIVLLPVTIWVQKNSIKMVQMMPKINRIKINHFGDKDTIAEETQKLYKENHYHATASLVPLVIQIALLLGVVGVIYHPMDYILGVPSEVTEKYVETVLTLNEDLNPESNSLQLYVVEDIQEGNTQPYLEAVNGSEQYIAEIQALKMKFAGFDLSWVASKEKGLAILIPLLAGFSAWLLSYMQNRMNVLQSAQSKGSQFGTMAFSVGISLYLGFFVPAGVALYWIASNLLTIVQQYLLNKAINPKQYIDYEEFEATRKILASYETGSKVRFRWNDPLQKREKADYKRFFSIGNKHLVFYSESNGFYKYYAGTIDYILKHTNIPLHYITSDPNDSIFEMAKDNPQIIPYYISSEKLITLMMKMDADVVVMTMPDLETYQIKRSYVRKDIKYIYIPHCMNSLNLTMRKGCTDHFDAVICTGKHMKEEIVKTEEVYNLPKKDLIEGGYPLLDDMIRDYQNMVKPEGPKTVLIAPSWQKDNIVDSCLDELLEQLKGHDYKVIVRPHPQHVRHMPERMEQLKMRFADDPSVEVQTDFSSNDTVFLADMLITDWSGIGYEYAFTTKKPVLFINTPMKIMNPDYKEIGIEPFNIYMRDILGASLDPEDIPEKAADLVSYLLSHAQEYEETIDQTVDEYCYALGRSGEVSARYIIAQCIRQVENRRGCPEFREWKWTDDCSAATAGIIFDRQRGAEYVNAMIQTAATPSADPAKTVFTHVATVQTNGKTYTDTACTGRCGDNAVWRLLSSGLLTISGSGSMNSYNESTDTAPWFSRKSEITALEIKGNISSIGDYAFSGCTKLAAVSLNDGIKTIGEGAFNNCTSLEAVDLPAHTIGNNAFNHCTRLKRVTVPDDLTEIGTSAFENCTSLKEISELGKITVLKQGVFKGCRSLKHVTIPETVTKIEAEAFFGCRTLKEAVIPSSITEIGTDAFADCSSLANVQYGSCYADWQNITGADGLLTLDQSIHYSNLALDGWEWSDNNKTAAASFKCSRHGTIEKTIEADVSEEIIEAACEKDGMHIYDAVVKFNGEAFTDARITIIPAFGHAYGEPSYEWSSDHNRCTARRICSHDSSHAEEETVTAVYAVTEAPSLTAEGQGTYTAVFTNTAFETQTAAVEIPKAERTVISVHTEGDDIAPEIAEAIRSASEQIADDLNCYETEEKLSAVYDLNSTETVEEQSYMQVRILEKEQNLKLELTPMRRIAAVNGENTRILSEPEELIVHEPVTVRIPAGNIFGNETKPVFIRQTRDGKSCYCTGTLENSVITFTTAGGFGIFEISETEFPEQRAPVKNTNSRGKKPSGRNSRQNAANRRNTHGRRRAPQQRQRAHAGKNR